MSDLQEVIYRTVELACAEAEKRERQRIIAILKWERQYWVREPVFNYRNKLTELIAKISAE